MTYLLMIETTLESLPVYAALSEASCRGWQELNIPSMGVAEQIARRCQDNLRRDHAGVMMVTLYLVEAGMCHQIEVLLDRDKESTGGVHLAEGTPISPVLDREGMFRDLVEAWNDREETARKRLDNADKKHNERKVKA
jgi:hypothetical protein